MNVYFVNRFYAPDTSATSQMLSDLTTHLAADFSVQVVTSRMTIDHPAALLPRHEKADGVETWRLGSTRFGRKKLWRKAIDLLSFHWSVFWFLLIRTGKGDIVVMKTDPPLLMLGKTAIVRWRGGRVVNWLQDIYPEVAVRLGAFPGPGWLAGFVESWRDRALNSAEANVVISDSMAEYLAERGVQHLRVIPNWANEAQLVTIDHAENSLREQWRLTDKFVVMYSGNFGRVHEFSSMLEAIRLVNSDEELADMVLFLMVGGGAGLTLIEDTVKESGWKNVSFKPFQPRSELHLSLGAADLHLVSLRVGMEQLVMPSKIAGILAAGRPIAYFGDVNGQIGQLLQSEEVGFVISEHEPHRLASEIRSMIGSPENAERFQKNARSLFEREFTLLNGCEQWKKLLLGLSSV